MYLIFSNAQNHQNAEHCYDKTIFCILYGMVYIDYLISLSE